MSESSERAAIGKQIQIELFGPSTATVKSLRSAVSELAPDLSDLSDDANWGGIWGRPGLPLQTKSLCVVIAMLATERYGYLRAHVEGIRRLGMSRDDLVSAMVQLTFYVGYPVVLEGLKVVREVYLSELEGE